MRCYDLTLTQGFLSYNLDNNNRHKIREIEILINSMNGVYYTFNGPNYGIFLEKFN